MSKYYAVAKGFKPGIYNTWDECQQNINGFSGARFKSFKTQQDAQKFFDEKSATVGSSTTSLKAITNINPPSILRESYLMGFAKPRQVKQMKVNVKSFNDLQKNNNRLEQKKSLKRKFTSTSKPQEVKKAKMPSHEIAGIIKDKLWNPIVKDCLMKCGTIHLLVDPDDPEYFCVYTDGACRKNGRKGQAGIGVYWGHENPWNVGRKFVGEQTNNRAEIAAMIQAVETAIDNDIRKLLIITDSNFTINCMTKWIYAWKKKNWTLSEGGSVKCRDVLEKLDSIITNSGIIVKYNHVRAHQGNVGNEAADRLANQGADEWRCSR